MKTIITSLVLLIGLSTQGFAQGEEEKNYALQKGDHTIGLDFGLSFSGEKINIDDDKMKGSGRFSIQLGPEYHHHITDNIAIGLGIDWTHSRNNNDREADPKTVSISNTSTFSPSVRIFQQLGANKRGGLFEQVNLNFILGKSKTEFDGEEVAGSENKYTTIGGSIDFGGYFMPTECVMLKLGVGMLNASTSRVNGTDTRTNDFSVSLKDWSQNMYIGVNVRF